MFSVFSSLFAVANGGTLLVSDSAQATGPVCNRADARREALDRHPGSRVIRVRSYRNYFLVTIIYRNGERDVIEIPLDC